MIPAALTRHFVPKCILAFCWIAFAFFPVSGCAQEAGVVKAKSTDSIVSLSFEVVERHKHNAKNFTQGLYLLDGLLYEGTGLYGQSKLLVQEWPRGKVLEEKRLPRTAFGEGVTVFNDRIYQLTWKAQLAYVYSKEGLKLKNILNYEGEGWGLTHNEEQLIMSNGSAQIVFRNPKTFEIERAIQVTRLGKPVEKLNELELIRGFIFANQWMSDLIFVIEPKTGRVVAEMDLSQLTQEAVGVGNQEAVLNGIAYNSEKDEILVTGKLWPILFTLKVDWAEISLLP